MLCRWDIQAALPDMLVTNYSMLEYMLIRPIESPIFEATRCWLERTTGPLSWCWTKPTPRPVLV